MTTASHCRSIELQQTVWGFQGIQLVEGFERYGLVSSVEAGGAYGLQSRPLQSEDEMITNDGNSHDKGIGQKVRSVGVLVLLAVLSYEIGLSHGRAEKSAGEYAALRTQYSALKAEYERDFAEYSAMKNRYDQVLTQYDALKAQYDRIEAKTNKTP